MLLPKFLHVLKNGQVLLEHTPPGIGGSPNNFVQRGLKNWLQMQRIGLHNFGAKWSSLTKF